MSINIKIALNEGLYLKEPQDSKLGRKINSTEASIYRYFENKHLLLLFLVNWYWEWANYLITINTINIKNPHKKLQIIIHSFIFASKENPTVDYVNEDKLHNIVISEGGKAYHTKDVDKENSKGFFSSYKDLVHSVSKVIAEINPNFKYPFALATNLFEMSNNQIYFAKHIPKLTDVSIKNNEKEVEKMLNYFTDKLLKCEE